MGRHRHRLRHGVPAAESRLGGRRLLRRHVHRHDAGLGADHRHRADDPDQLLAGSGCRPHHDGRRLLRRRVRRLHLVDSRQCAGRGFHGGDLLRRLSDGPPRPGRPRSGAGRLRLLLRWHLRRCGAAAVRLHAGRPRHRLPVAGVRARADLRAVQHRRVRGAWPSAALAGVGAGRADAGRGGHGSVRWRAALHFRAVGTHRRLELRDDRHGHLRARRGVPHDRRRRRGDAQVESRPRPPASRRRPGDRAGGRAQFRARISGRRTAGRRRHAGEFLRLRLAEALPAPRRGRRRPRHRRPGSRQQCRLHGLFRAAAHARHSRLRHHCGAAWR